MDFNNLKEINYCVKEYINKDINDPFIKPYVPKLKYIIIN